MASKPATVPQWDSANLNVTTPVTQLTDGWATGSVGVSSYMNWFMRLVWQWVAYLKDGIFTAEVGQPAVTGTGNNNVGGKFTGHAAGNAGAQGNGSVAGSMGVEGFGTNGNAGGEFNGHGVGPGFIGRGGSTNGNGGMGFADGSGAGLYGQSETGPGVKALKGSSSGNDAIETDGYLKFTGSAPSAATAVSKRVVPGSALTAWGMVTFNGTASPTLNEGLNVGTLSIAASILNVPFPTGGEMSPGNYSVTLTLDDGAGATLYHPRVAVSQTTGFTVRIRDSAGSTVNAATLSGLVLYFQVAAKQ